MTARLGTSVAGRARGVAAACVLALCGGACETNAGGGGARATAPEIKDVTHPDYQAPELPRGTVVLTDAFGGSHAVEVEVAATTPTRTRGLMWRKQLAAGKGMLFVFPDEEVQSFWMRNTLIPLDMIFINGQLEVVGIVENAEPKTLVSRSVGRPGRYVLEVPGGWSSKIGLRAGSKVQLRGGATTAPE